jgi:hypothetical protein
MKNKKTMLYCVVLAAGCAVWLGGCGLIEWPWSDGDEQGGLDDVSLRISGDTIPGTFRSLAEVHEAVLKNPTDHQITILTDLEEYEEVILDPLPHRATRPLPSGDKRLTEPRWS